MDITRAVNAPFRDRQWPQKALLGGLWAVLVVTTPVLGGYFIEYMRNVAHGAESPLPEWVDFGAKWVKGLMLAVASFLYSLPAMLLTVGAFYVVYDAANHRDFFTGEIPPEALPVALLLLLMAGAYSLAASVFVMAGAVEYAMTDDFGCFFRPGGLLGRLRDTSFLKTWLVVIVVTSAAGAAGGIAGGILEIVPVLGRIASAYVSGVVGFIGWIISGHLFGQYAGTAFGIAPRPATGIPQDPPPPAMNG